MDENVHLAVAEALRRRGIDATTAADPDLISAPDARHLEFARNQGRVIVTHDADFLRMHATGVTHAGIIYSAAGTRSLGDLIRSLTALHVARTAESMVNTLTFI